VARRKVLRNAFDRRAESGGTWDGGARVAVGRSGGWGMGDKKGPGKYRNNADTRQ
jgi:hypothetical protein